jgi:uncharacterized protein YoxC
MKRSNLVAPTIEQANELIEQFNTLDDVSEGDSIYAVFFNAITELSERLQELEKKSGDNVSD